MPEREPGGVTRLFRWGRGRVVVPYSFLLLREQERVCVCVCEREKEKDKSSEGVRVNYIDITPQTRDLLSFTVNSFLSFTLERKKEQK